MRRAAPADASPSAGGADETPSSAPPLPPAHALPALIIFALLFFTVALQFFTRYVLNDSLGWTEEIARYLLILLGFSGGILCARNNSHIALEFFYRYLPAAAARALAAGCRLISAAFFLYCGWLAIELAERTGSSMASVQLPKAVIYYLVAVFCAAAAVYAAAFLLPRRRRAA